MVNSCAVSGCTNRSTRDKKSYYVLPSVITNQGDKTKELSEKRRQQWITNLKRKSFTPSRHTRICSDHFTSGKPSALYDTANPDWAPTVNMGDTTPEQHKEKKKNLEAAETLLNLALLFEENEVSDSNKDTPKPKEAAQTKSSASTQTDPPDPSPEQIQSMKEELQKLKTELDDLRKELQIARIPPKPNPLDPSPKLLQGMREELQRLTTENMDLKKELQSTKICPESFHDEEKARFYSGLPSFVAMMTVFSLIEPYIKENSRSPVTKFQKYIMTLMKLRLNVPMQDLAYRFNVSVASVSNTFRHVINIMYHRLRPLISWPKREVLQKTMPLDFRRTFGVKVVVILDCFEIHTDRPSNVVARAQTWSSCKNHNTIKFMIGIAPQGAITFVSSAWGGGASDRFITENCGILDKLLPHDMVLADRGFDAEESTGLVCARLKMPALDRGKRQLAPLPAEETRKISHVRIHFKRVIGNVRNKFTILNGPLPIDFLNSDATKDVPLIDKIVMVCCGLVNLCESVVSLN